MGPAFAEEYAGPCVVAGVADARLGFCRRSWGIAGRRRGDACIAARQRGPRSGGYAAPKHGRCRRWPTRSRRCWRRNSPALLRQARLSGRRVPRQGRSLHDLVEQVTRSVLDQLSDRVVRETVRDMVTEVAERLVREEIERIKSSIK